MHRWTARAVAQLHPDAARQAHRRAAAFWHWRVDTIPQSRQDDIDQLLEARYHHHAAGNTDEAMAATEEAVLQLQTWGQYGRAAELCRETLTWLTPGSPKAAATEGTLGILAQLRGDFAAAERSYRQALEIFERIGDQAGMSVGYHQLGMLAERRGDFAAAERSYRQALEIFERIGDQAGMSVGYHQLGMLAERRGDYEAAEPLYRRALEISERIGDQAGVATSYTTLAGLSEAAGNLDEAVTYRAGALAIRLNIGIATAAEIQPLTGLRRRLGRDRFRAALPSGMDEESADTLMQLLDQHEEEEAAGD